MKKIIILIILITLFFIYKNSLLVAQAASAAPKTPATPATPGAIMNQQEIEKIQKLKDLVASRVAELNLIEKKGILGIVKDTGNTQISLEDSKNSKRIIDIDELTKFQGGAAQKSFGISDIKTGDTILALGLYNKETKRLLARFVTLKKSLPVQFAGLVLAKDNKNYQFTAINENGSKKTVEAEAVTKTNSYSQEAGIIRSGFSKIKTGERIFVTGYYDLKNNDIIIADRILALPTLPLSAFLKSALESLNKDLDSTAGAK